MANDNTNKKNVVKKDTKKAMTGINPIVENNKKNVEVEKENKTSIVNTPKTDTPSKENLATEKITKTVVIEKDNETKKPEQETVVEVKVTKTDIKKEEEYKTKAKKILFCASESAPFSRTGGLGDVAGALPAQLVKIGNDVRVVTPLYGTISNDYRQTMKFIGSIYVPLSWRYQYCGVYELTHNGVKFYFIDNEYYFKRDSLYGHYDDGEKFAFFSRAILEILPLIEFYPEIIHCNDWHTALVPVFLDCFYRERENYKDIKTVFTIHNIEFQGKYDKYLITDILGISQEKANLVKYNDCCNYMKGGIECSNLVTTVSQSYANEILDPYYSYGLDAILKERSFKLRGILNGIDTNVYDPSSDKALFKNYDINSIEDKKLNKEGLCNLLNLHYDPLVPMICMVTRLSTQKGLDLLSAVIEELLAARIQFVIIGTGEWRYETLFTDIENKYRDKFKMIVKFSPDLAAKIYAAADIFLMPSRFEPCGLSQMIAMRYGSIPVVRETGGLKDTVKHYDYNDKTGSGFTFYSYNAHDMLNSIWNAVDCFYNKKDDWKQIINNAMKNDFSWKRSAIIYDQYYNELILK